MILDLSLSPACSISVEQWVSHSLLFPILTLTDKLVKSLRTDSLFSPHVSVNKLGWDSIE